MIRRANINDVDSIVIFFKNYPEVAFEEWQNSSFLKDNLLQKTTIVLLLEIDNTICGILYGGIMGSRATINHFAISDKFRSLGYGKKFLTQFKNIVKSYGIYKIFLFVNLKNTAALEFYTNNGFQQIENEITLEINV